ncbi:MAG: LysE family translocator [Oceanospirillaceae bacterium]|nr:LysE family translocator [Oceanospirillaceae bacterium]
MTEINYLLIITAVFLSIVSPGPATIAIASASANNGHRHGSTLAFGIATGGFVWSCAAAFGLSAILYTNTWLFELMRYFGAGYLLYLAYKSLRSACSHKDEKLQISAKTSLKLVYIKGMALQLSNPKAILTFASVYAIFLPANTSPVELITVIVSISIMANMVFQLYAFLFSTPKVRHAYFRLRRYFEAFFAFFFGVAGFKILTSNLE